MPVCIPVSPTATHWTKNRVRTWSSSREQPVGVGDEDPPVRVGVRRADLADRVALGPGGVVGPGEEVHLAGLLDRLREHLHLVRGRHRLPRAATTVCVPLACRAVAADAASAASRSESSERSAVCANPVVSPRTTRMPAPRSRPEVSSSTLPSSSRADEARRSSTNTSAKSPPPRKRGVQGPFQHCVRRSSDLRSSRCGQPSYPTPMPVEPGLVATAEMIVGDADTALALRSGDVPVLATPRVVSLAEEATVLAVGDRLEAGTTSVGYRVQLDHLAPTAVGGRVTAEAVLEVGRGPAAHVPGVGERRPRPRRRGPHHPGRGRARPLPREGRRGLTAAAGR